MELIPVVLSLCDSYVYMFTAVSTSNTSFILVALFIIVLFFIINLLLPNPYVLYKFNMVYPCKPIGLVLE